MATLANAITCGRAVVVTLILILASDQTSRELLLIGLFVSWVGDVLDGFLARHYERETVFGAQLDYNVDRLVATGVIIAATLIGHGDTLVIIAATAVSLQYGVLDQFLCSQFLRFGLWSPDEFWLHDRPTWLLNWAPIAKLAGHVPLFLLAVGSYGAIPSIVIATFLVVARGVSYLFNRTQITPALTNTPTVGREGEDPDLQDVAAADAFDSTAASAQASRA